MSREPSLRGWIRHATELRGLHSPREMLVASCREALRLTGSALALGSYGVPGQPWDQRVHVIVPAEDQRVPSAVVSVLFAIHRRLSSARGPLTLQRSGDTAAIFSAFQTAMGKAGLEALRAAPIVHRTGRLAGGLIVVDESIEQLTGAPGDLLLDLAKLAAAALESAQRLMFARRDQERLHLLAEASEEALWDWSLDTREFWWGGGIQKLLGRGPGAVLHSAEWKFDRIHPTDSARIRDSFQRALSSTRESFWRDEYRFRRGDDSSIIVEDRAHFLRDSTGRVYRVVGAMRDVSPLKRMIEREKEARAEAEMANRAKDDFLAMLGHELRNPLAPILTALELLRIRGAADSDKERAIIERQARHMVRLVDDLLDVSRVATGKIELQKERVELADVIARAAEMARPIIAERGHELRVSVARTGLLVDADPARLAQVFCNLLTNAGKYTESSGRIVVTAERQGGTVEVKIADNGMGIAPEMLGRIFDLFVQERQALDRAKGGLGLGLSIARSLVTLHGGAIEAQSQGRGHGSVFSVRLPLAVPVMAASNDRFPGSGETEAASERPLRILVVDDNADAAELIAEYLRHRGHTIQIAHDGMNGLQAAAEFSPDVVLLDIGLPVMNGYELARRLRQRAHGGRPLLLALSGYGQTRDQRLAEEATFDAYLVKPVTAERLEQTMWALMDSRVRAA